MEYVCMGQVLHRAHDYPLPACPDDFGPGGSFDRLWLEQEVRNLIFCVEVKSSELSWISLKKQ